MLFLISILIKNKVIYIYIEILFYYNKFRKLFFKVRGENMNKIQNLKIILGRSFGKTFMYEFDFILNEETVIEILGKKHKQKEM